MPWPLAGSKEAEFGAFAAAYNQNTSTGAELKREKGFERFHMTSGSVGQPVMKTLPHCDLQCFHAEVFGKG